MSFTYDQLPHKDKKRQYPSCGISICWEHSAQVLVSYMVSYNEISFYISCSLCLAFRLCSGMNILYTSLEVIKLAFLENESRYVCCMFANFIFTSETKFD